MEEQQVIEGKKSRRKLIIGVSAVVALLVAGAVVGTWLVGVGPLGGEESAATPFERFMDEGIPGLPEGTPAAMGLVTNVTATILDLAEPVGMGQMERTEGGEMPGGGGMPEGGEMPWRGGGGDEESDSTGFPEDLETEMVQVVLSKETKVLKLVTSIGRIMEDEDPEFTEVSLADIETGQMIMVWGEESGDRIYADTIVLQRL